MANDTRRGTEPEVGASAPIDPPVVVDATRRPNGHGDGIPDPPEPRIPEHKLQAIALMSLNGVPASRISEFTGVSTHTVGKFLDPRIPTPRYDAVHDAYQIKIINGVIHQQVRLLDLLDQSYKAIQDALTGNDPKLAADNAWKVIEAVNPPKKDTNSGVQINVGVDNVHVQQEFREVQLGLSDTLKRLGQVIGGGSFNPNKHILTGDAALPSAIPSGASTTQRSLEPEVSSPSAEVETGGARLTRGAASPTPLSPGEQDV